MRTDVYSIVTERIITQLQSGTVAWRKPWASKPPANLISQKDYRGINQFLLGGMGFASQYWLTFNQASKLGGRVKAGAKSSPVVFWKIGEEREYVRKDGTSKTGKSILLRYSNVFNLEQTEGIAEKLGLDKQPARVPDIAACERIVKDMPQAPALEQSGAAWYRPSTDTVGMPARALFNSPEGFYATYFHELTHSTGHASRLARPGIMEKHYFGDSDYSREELVAEMSAAMLCAVTGIAPAVLDNSVAYIQNWIRVLKGDSKLLVQAASAAAKSADWIQGIKASPASATDTETDSAPIAEQEVDLVAA
jgi:antirestriction protein ArdC